MKLNRLSLQKKFLLTFLSSTVIILVVNIFLFININNVINRIDKVYSSNMALNELSEALDDVQKYMDEFLNTKSNYSLEDYYRAVSDFRRLIDELNQNVTSDSMLLKEKIIHNLSDTYLKYTDETVSAKRGRIIEKYKVSYEESLKLYSYISTYIYTLNSERFTENSYNYGLLLQSFRTLEIISIIVLFALFFANTMISYFITKSITEPLIELAKTADEVASGNFDVKPVKVETADEIGIVAGAFNQMVERLKGYVDRIRENIERENEMKKHELLMEANLKDAKLKYLQAQINPHFLFNTLNAGAQLAMLEDADKTYDFIQNMAAFFRYNVKKDNESTTLGDEVRLVDNYIYILNVRFSGDIHFKKDIDERFLSINVPSMIIQPLVENAVNYGVRNISWESEIILSIKEDGDRVKISVKDNGIGMTQERIAQVLSGNAKTEDVDDSNGVGLNNVINRLSLMLHSENVIDIVSEGQDKGTEVILYIPIIEESEE